MLIGGSYILDEQVYFPRQSNGLGDSYIRLPPSAMESYKIVTIELWATVPLVSGSADLMTLFYFGSPSSSVRCSHSQIEGQIMCAVCSNPSTCTSMLSTSSYSFATIHLVATFDSISGSMSLSVNSVLQSSVTFTSSLPDPGGSNFNFLLGASPSNVNELLFVGSIDEFRVWAGSMTTSTITSRYENGPTPGNIGKCGQLLLLDNWI